MRRVWYTSACSKSDAATLCTEDASHAGAPTTCKQLPSSRLHACTTAQRTRLASCLHLKVQGQQTINPPEVKLLKLRWAAACTPLTLLPLLLLLRVGPPSVCCGGGAGCGTLKKPSASSNSSRLQAKVC